MRFMRLYKPGRETDVPLSEREIAEMGAFVQELASECVWVATDCLQSSSKGARVRISKDKFTVTDRPSTETKALVAGFAILQVRSKADAIDLAKRFLRVAGEGESEIRLMHDTPAYPPAVETAISAQQLLQ